MRLTSTAFASNAWIPAQFTCDGRDASPPLAWSNPPVMVRSFALVCSDPDAPGGTWYHWAIWDIAPTTLALPANLPPMQAGPPQGTNDFGRVGYSGPCPPPGARPHRYLFRLYALDRARLGLSTNIRCRDVDTGARVRAIETAELVGLYGRKG
jgi:Raf kinase inhibitor-like YbhB/YbcL family protein